MPNNTNQPITSYNDIDEILAAPPSFLLRYGSATLLMALIICFCIGYFLKYEDGFYEQASISSLNSVEIKSPTKSMDIFKVLVKNNRVIKAGEPLLILKSEGILDTIKSKITGNIYVQRLLVERSILEPNVPLFFIENEIPIYKVSILVSEIHSPQIRLAQKVDITTNANYEKQSQQIEAKVVSLPYKVVNNKMMNVDAEISGNKKLSVFLHLEGRAFIKTGEKRLISKLIAFLH